MPSVVALILHAPLAPGAGPLTRIFEAIRREHATRHAAGFAALGARAIVDDGPGGASFGARVRAVVTRERPDGLIVLGSGAVPIAGTPERRLFVRVAGGPAGRALANNRYSADVVAVAGAAVLDRLPDVASDNALPRWLATEAGFAVDDLRTRWRLQLDLDSPLDALLIEPGPVAASLAGAGVDSRPVVDMIRAIGAVTRDPARELVVAGRASAAGLAWLERATRSRTRALVEERGFRTRPPGQRPVRSALGLVLDRDGPEALGPRLAELGDAAIVDSRVLIAHRFGADEAGWPSPEDRFASDLAQPDRIADPWLRALTRSAADAAIPVGLGGHTLVGPGLRLVLDDSRWT
ncbi:MAG TPA: hypothetical protein VFI34_06035 [Candidatus Limnocylindrales bacterium]|nr:hypothetical protein [Candidatus Limnocylindrales bacterium]